MTYEEYLNEIEDFDDVTKQELLADFQNHIPLDNPTMMQKMGYGGFQDLMKVKNDAQTMQLGETIRGMNNVSPLLTMGAVSGNSTIIKDTYFIDATPIDYNGIMVINDAGTDPDEIKIVEKDFYYYPESKNKKFAYHVKIFISTSAKKLEEAFKNTKAAENELLIFVEDNSTDKTSFIYGAVTVGSKLRENLLSTYESDVTENKNLIRTILDSFVLETGYIIEEGFVKELLKNGKAEYPALKTISVIYTVIDFISFGAFTEVSNYGVSMLLDKAIEFINKGKIEDHRWNPKAQKAFDPKFYPIALEQELDKLDDSELNEKIRTVIQDLTTSLKEYDIYFSSLLNIPAGKKKDPKNMTLSEIVYDAFRQVYQKCKHIIDNLENIDVSDILKTGIRAWNAFICGVWNSLVDAVTSLLDMIKMIINISTSGKELMKNLDTQLPRLVERVEEALQAWEKLDFKKCTLYFMKKMTESSFGFSVEQLAYYIGFAYGFVISLIIEVVIGLLLTGGVISVEEIARRLVQELFGFFTTIAKGVRKAWNKGFQIAKKTIDGFITGLDVLVDFLKQGWEGFKKWVDDAFDAIEKLAKARIDQFIKTLPSNTGKFINLLSKEFPALQKKIVDGFLILEFKGRKFLRMNPKGIIVEIKYFRELNNYTYFTELKKVKIELEVVDDLGRKTIKKYEDTVEVMKKGDDVGFRAKFEEGKIRDGEYINYTFERSGNYNPFAVKPASKSKVIDKVLKEGDEFYIVEFKDRTLQREVPGAWASNYEVKSIKELREKLQVLKEFKDEARGELVVRKYRIKAGKELPSREGYIGDLKTGVNKGPKQWEFINAWEKGTFNEFIQQINFKIIK